MITLEKPKALYLQIAAYYEKEIVSGRLLPGDKIPATTALAKKFKVNADTVQQSLKLLMSRGLIDRKPGRGTYVRTGVNSKSIGIVFGKEIYTNPDVMFFSIYIESLGKILEANGWNCRFYSTSEFATYDRAFYDLKSSVESGEVRAVIEFCSNDLVREWLETECPVPVSKNQLAVDYYDFTYKGLDHLYKNGCRKIAIQEYCPDGSNKHYCDAVNDFCLDRNDPELQIKEFRCSSHANEGYQNTKQIWESDFTPDGLLTANDSAFRGTLYALLELGVKIPDVVKLITYANKGVDIFCHLPLTKLEVNSDKFAEQTFKEIKARLEGNKIELSSIKAELIVGKSCGE